MPSLKHLRSLVVVSFLLGAGLLTLPTALSLASPVELPPRPQPSTPAPAHHAAAVASIELQATAPAGTWTVVQWAGGGQWFDVEGWRCELGPYGRVVWWVEAKDFGTGPFRWVVYDEAGGQPLDISADFNLPGSAAERLYVTAMPVPAATPTATTLRLPAASTAMPTSSK
jgi:hypothetical protein